MCNPHSKNDHPPPFDSFLLHRRRLNISYQPEWHVTRLPFYPLPLVPLVKMQPDSTPPTITSLGFVGWMYIGRRICCISYGQQHYEEVRPFPFAVQHFSLSTRPRTRLQTVTPLPTLSYRLNWTGLWTSIVYIARWKKRNSELSLWMVIYWISILNLPPVTTCRSSPNYASRAFSRGYLWLRLPTITGEMNFFRFQ